MHGCASLDPGEIKIEACFPDAPASCLRLSFSPDLVRGTFVHPTAGTCTVLGGHGDLTLRSLKGFFITPEWRNSDLAFGTFFVLCTLGDDHWLGLEGSFQLRVARGIYAC
jgi:hypothetical protein